MDIFDGYINEQNKPAVALDDRFIWLDNRMFSANNEERTTFVVFDVILDSECIGTACCSLYMDDRIETNIKISIKQYDCKHIEEMVCNELTGYSDTSGLWAKKISLRDMLKQQRIMLDTSEYGCEEICTICNYVSPSYSPDYCLSCI